MAVAVILCLLLPVLSKVRRSGYSAFVAAVSDRRNQSAWDRWNLSVADLRDSLNQAAVGDRRYSNLGLRFMALSAVLGCLLLATLSCGGGSSGGGTPHSTAESGIVTITGSSGSTSHTATISVSVN
jgi:hypothetical protein